MATGEVAAALADAPLVATPEGGIRFAGLIAALVDDDFNTGYLPTDPHIELVHDSHLGGLGLRNLLIKLNDFDLDRGLNTMRALPGIVAVGPNVALTVATSDPYWQGQLDAGLSLIDTAGPWSLTRGRYSTRVAVVDTGVNPVPELFGRVAVGRNFLGGTPTTDTSDPHGHGTMAATIIAAEQDDDGIAGIAPLVTIVPVRACAVTIICPTTAIYDALGWLFDEASLGRIDVINMSVGSPTQIPGIDPIIEGIAGLGVPVVASAGNYAETPVQSPARAPYAIAVGGVLPNGSHHPLSNYGQVDVVAPYQTWAIDHNGTPFYAEGTSFAAPVVSGLLALMKSDMLIEMSEFVPTLWMNRPASWNQYTGNGVPDVYRMMWDRSCAVFDFNYNRTIDVQDLQVVAYRWGSVSASPLYEPRYDLQPPYYQGDGDIDINDLSKVAGRSWMTCPT